MHRKQLLPIGMCVSFLSNAVSGLAHLHELNIIHTDLSMSNMRVTVTDTPACSQGADGRVLRISDFGGAISAMGIVAPCTRLITTEYGRAPETILRDSNVTEAVDLWCLGVVALALSCGSLVFYRRNGLEPRVQHLLQASEEDESIPGRRTLANQVAVLGPLDEANFPGCTSLPGWSDLQSVIDPGLCWLTPW